MRSALQLVVRPFELLSTLDSILSVSGYNILHDSGNVKHFLCEIYLNFSEIAKQPDKLQKTPLSGRSEVFFAGVMAAPGQGRP